MLPCSNAFEKLLMQLFDADKLAAASLAGSSCECGGAWHVANYFRKPRGYEGYLPRRFSIRFSFCCSRCRRRMTPSSLRFDGRAVYLKLWFLWCAFEGSLSVKKRYHNRHSLQVQKWWHASLWKSDLWNKKKATFVPGTRSLKGLFSSIWSESKGFSIALVKTLLLLE